jgi:phage terminase large subunit-like protein
MDQNTEPVLRGRAIAGERWDDALAMYLAGATAREVEAATGIAQQTIYNRVIRLGLGKRKAHAPRKPVTVRKHISAEAWAQLRQDYENGATAPACAKHYDTTVHAIKRRARVEHWGKIDPLKPVPAPLVVAPDPAEAPLAPEDALARWRAAAHPAQWPPDGSWATWLFQGGRGAGKTRAGAEWLAARAAETPDGVFALIGATLRDVREVMIEGPSGLMHLPHRVAPKFEAARQRLVFASGAVAYAFSASEPRRLRGPQFDGAWADEFCAWHRPKEALEILRFALRRGPRPQLVVTTTPKPTTTLRNLRAEGSCVTTLAPSSANAAHLSPRFLETLNDIYAGTSLAAQELEGLIVEGTGALWRASDFERVRDGRPPELDWTVVAVDPPAGVGVSACGIVVAGRRGRAAYVLADRTISDASPLGWAHAVRDAARAFGAREIVAEANQGGHMVRATLASADVAAPIRLVHARDGKRARAAPVAALYEQGRVVHTGAFPALEEQLMALGEAEMDGRLDRADALVWAITALLIDGRSAARPRLAML